MARQDLERIRFHYLQNNFRLVDRSRLKRFLASLFRREGKRLQGLNYIFCSDDYLLQVNKQYLQHDTYTDIITFQLSSPSEPILSDVYISIDRVKENSKTFNTSFKQELHRVIFHGALHLCDFKDKNASQQRLMRTKEEEYLKSYFVPRGTR